MDTKRIGDAVPSSEAARRLAERQPLADDVYDVVIDMLMNHSLAPGARLNIDGLSRMLGVSPTPVREALARVESEGLILKEPRRGYAVAPLIGLDELSELIELRLLVEPAAAAAAARRATSPEGTALRAFARTGGAGRHNDIAANRLDMTYDAAFHDMVASLAGNKLLRETLARLRSHLHMYRLYHHVQQASATKPEHVAIARAIANHDPDGARTAMEVHLETALRRLNEVFTADGVPLRRPTGDGPPAPAPGLLR